MTEALELQPSISDGDLARAAADGDRHAFAEIYDRYADRLYDFCLGLIGDRDAAADCVQDAFCVAATDLGGLRDPDKLRPWLYSIARHHAMRRLRHRYREEVSDELPDMISHEASPETLAGQSELARLVAEAAGGLSDRDRELLDLSYRHGLDGPELAETLGITLTSANTMMFRLRQTVERCLGALLVARGAHADPQACAELAAILKDWDGQFSILMRKRVARHIDSCETCEQDQRRYVNPVALLGGAPVFIPAPDWLRRQTLDRVQLTCASSGLSEASGDSASSGPAEASAEEPGDLPGSRHIGKRRMALLIVLPLLCLIASIAWFARPEEPVSKLVDTGAVSSDLPRPATPAAIKGPPTTVRSLPRPREGTAPPAVPTLRAETAPGAGSPGSAPVLPALPTAPPTSVATVPDPPITIAVPEIESVPDIDAVLIDSAPGDTAPGGNPTGTKPKPPGQFSGVPNLKDLFPNVDIAPKPKPNLGLPKPNTGAGTNPTAPDSQ